MQLTNFGELLVILYIYTCVYTHIYLGKYDDVKIQLDHLPKTKCLANVVMKTQRNVAEVSLNWPHCT